MTRDERSPLLYLRDIDKALDKILSRTRIMNFDSFIKDEFFIDAVVRNLQIMGEAAKFLPEEMKDYPEGSPDGPTVSVSLEGWRGSRGQSTVRDKFMVHDYLLVASVMFAWSA